MLYITNGHSLLPQKFVPNDMLFKTKYLKYIVLPKFEIYKSAKTICKMIYKAVILAGGKGTRLGSISKKIPKPLLLINSKPLLHHQIDLLITYGVKEIYVITNYLSEKIEESLLSIKTQDTIKIFVHKESKELGTVGGIKEISHKLKEDFYVLYGDIMLDIDLNRVEKFHFKNNSDATLIVHPTDHPKDSDLLEVNEFDKVIKFHTKDTRDMTLLYPNVSNAGLYLFSPKIFRYLKKGVKADFGKDIFPNTIDKLNFYAYNTPEYLKDIGTPERLLKVQKDFLHSIIQSKNLERKQKAIFIDRDGVINELAGYISKPEQLNVYKNSIRAIKQINSSNFLAILITNQPVIARGLCTVRELQEIHNLLEFILSESGAKLDAIFFCPHHPDKGFKGENVNYKKDCTCRKPKTGMIDKAVKKFNIDVKKSYLVGDSWRDIQCGKNAKVKTVLVGKSNEKIKITPDLTATNLLDAVTQILN